MYTFSRKNLVSEQNMLIISILKHIKPAAWKLFDNLSVVSYT